MRHTSGVVLGVVLVGALSAAATAAAIIPVASYVVETGAAVAANLVLRNSARTALATLPVAGAAPSGFSAGLTAFVTGGTAAYILSQDFDDGEGGVTGFDVPLQGDNVPYAEGAEVDIHIDDTALPGGAGCTGLPYTGTIPKYCYPAVNTTGSHPSAFPSAALSGISCYTRDNVLGPGHVGTISFGTPVAFRDGQRAGWNVPMTCSSPWQTHNSTLIVKGICPGTNCMPGPYYGTHGTGVSRSGSGRVASDGIKPLRVENGKFFPAEADVDWSSEELDEFPDDGVTRVVWEVAQLWDDQPMVVFVEYTTDGVVYDVGRQYEMETGQPGVQERGTFFARTGHSVQSVERAHANTTVNQFANDYSKANAGSSYTGPANDYDSAEAPPVEDGGVIDQGLLESWFGDEGFFAPWNAWAPAFPPGECPDVTLPWMGGDTITETRHCDMFEANTGALSAAFAAMWLCFAFLTVLEA